VDDFIAPVNVGIGYPPANIDGTKGFGDITIPTLYALDRLGMHKARRSGNVRRFLPFSSLHFRSSPLERPH
jgi:hypothetical protein